jgi:hypothetical protein
MSIKELVKSFIPDEIMLQRWSAINLGSRLNLKNPSTFNEKINWLKLHDRNPLYTTLVDKYAVKKWVADKIGIQYVVPTIGVWKTFDEIEFDKLPNQFVLKCTHDSGGLAICQNKDFFDFAAARKTISDSLKRNYYYAAREWPYKNVPPRIIAEKYMEDQKSGGLPDYKFYTFNGTPKFLLLASNRHSKDKPLCFDYFDMQFNHLTLENYWHPNNVYAPPHKPENFEKMKSLCKILAKDIPHVRVDFYEVNGHVYFGEMTFFPQGGFLRLKPNSWEKEWGSLIKLPQK